VGHPHIIGENFHRGRTGITATTMTGGFLIPPGSPAEGPSSVGNSSPLPRYDHPDGAATL
jgi:hypothetical protein